MAARCRQPRPFGLLAALLLAGGLAGCDSAAPGPNEQPEATGSEPRDAPGERPPHETAIADNAAVASRSGSETRNEGQDERGGMGARAPGTFDSVYVDIERTECATLAQDPESGAIRQRCVGYRDIPLFVHDADARIDIDAGADDGRFDTLSALNGPGSRVEFRLHQDRPIAIIYRVKPGPEGGRPVLFVKKIGDARTSGCTIARIDATRPRANARAREVADTLAATFDCGVDRPRNDPKTN